MNLPLLDLAALNAEVGAELDAALARTRAAAPYVLGPEVEAFEADVFRDWHSCRSAAQCHCDEVQRAS